MATVETPSPQALERIERELGFSAIELAELLDVTPEELGRSRADRAKVPRRALARFADLESVDRHLHQTFMPEAIPTWLRTVSRYLGGLTPLDELRRGRAERVEAALEAIDSGFVV